MKRRCSEGVKNTRYGRGPGFGAACGADAGAGRTSAVVVDIVTFRSLEGS